MSCKFVAVALVALAGTTPAMAFNNVPAASRASLGIGSSFIPLDMTGLAYLNGSLSASNSYSQSFTGPNGNYTGTLSAEVFGNVGTPGPGLSDLVIVYTFVGDGGPGLIRLNGAERFEFGVDTSVEIDRVALDGSTMGRITADTSMQAGQLDPAVTVSNNIGGNDVLDFNFNPSTSSGRLVELGGNTAALPGDTEVFTWYVRTSGNVGINFVDVRISDFGFTTIRSLTLVSNPSQPNLNVPTPGAAALAALAGLVGLRRRRSA